MIRRAVADGVPLGVVLGDSAYGNAGWFREELRTLGLPYGVDVLSTTTIQCVDEQGVCPPSSAHDLARRLGRKAFRRYTWREGTRHRLESRFAFKRVWVPGEPGESLLVIEWPLTESDAV